jgi:hypothetical protein
MGWWAWMDYWSEREGGWTGVEGGGKGWMMLLCICPFYPSCGVAGSFFFRLSLMMLDDRYRLLSSSGFFSERVTC